MSLPDSSVGQKKSLEVAFLRPWHNLGHNWGSGMTSELPNLEDIHEVRLNSIPPQ